MSTSERPIYRLTLEIPEPGLAVIVLDAEGSVVAHSDGDLDRIAVDLPRGLYVARATRSGLFREMPVRLDAARTLRVEPPPHFSAATVPSAETTHEYYTYPAWEASYRATGPEVAWNGAPEASLLIFIRAPRADRYRGEDLRASLSLRTPSGDTLTHFETDVRHDRSAGWAAYSVPISPGTLVLEDNGPQPRQIPVPLMSGWQTQLFVIHHRRRLWQDMHVASVSLDEIDTRSNRDPYDTNAEDVAATTNIDLGLFALQNDVDAVADRLVNAFLNSKFSNPILGLLGAYLLLLRARRGATPDLSLYGIVLDNLNRVLPGSADVRALRLVAREWLGPPPPGPVDGFPLFRRGAEIVIAAAAEDPALIPEGSLLDAASEHLYGDTVWTTWRRLPLPVTAHPELAAVSADEESDWVELAVADAVAAAGRRDIEPAVEDIVRQVGVSPHAFRRAFDRLLMRASERPNSLEASGSDLRVLGGDIAQRVVSKFGSRIGTDLLSQIAKQAQRSTRTPSPSYQTIYAGLKRTLADVAHVEIGTVLAETELTDLLDREDIRGRLSVRHQLLRQFRDAGLRLSIEDMGTADTVRDLAHLVRARTKR